MHHHNADYIRAVDAARIAGRRSRDLADIVQAAAAGDSHAWSAIVEQFSARVRRAARACSLAAHDVDDVEQTTWIRLLGAMGSIHNPAAIGAWLETTARREGLRALQRNDRESPMEGERFASEAVEPVAETRVVEEERRTAIRQAVQRLPGHQRDLLSLLLSESSPPYEEIARSLQIPIGSIGPTRARGIERLRQDRQLAETVR